MDARRKARQRGAAVAVWLSGAWRHSPPPLEPVSAEAVPLLAKSGAAGLAWWRLRDSPVRHEGAFAPLERGFRFYAIEAVVRQRQILRAVGALRAAGIEPLLSKGWAVARLYPHPAMRPYRDIDLLVPPASCERAAAILRGIDRPGPVELHPGFSDLPDRGIDGLYERSQAVRVEDVELRLFSPEDELRHVCVHLLRHGISRAVWLCDVAVMLENLPPRFRWDWCLEGSARRSEWVLAALQLAHRLLGATLDRVPGGLLPETAAPRWLDATVLRQWGTLRTIPEPMTASLASPIDFARALQVRWPNAVEATVQRGGRFDETPRLPLQVGCVVLRGGRWLRRRALTLLPGASSRRRRPGALLPPVAE